MKLNKLSRANLDPDTARWYAQIAQQVNAISEGQMVGFYGARTSVPTTGTWAQGDEVKNSAPTELGAAASKYIIVGWKCVASGTPGTWLQMRTLTGN